MTTQKTSDWRERFDERFKISDSTYSFDTVNEAAEQEAMGVKSFIESLLAEQREEIRGRVEKTKEENLTHLCKAISCSDPICGHSRCIDWMYAELLALPCLQIKEK